MYGKFEKVKERYISALTHLDGEFPRLRVVSSVSSNPKFNESVIQSSLQGIDDMLSSKGQEGLLPFYKEQQNI